MKIPLLLSLVVSYQLIAVTHSQLIEIPQLVGKGTFNISGTYHEEKDVHQVWYTTQAIELTVHEYKIDIQSGDFVILSKYLLEWDSGRNRPKIPIREYSLLSNARSDEYLNEYNATTVQMVNPDGVAIYFHGTPLFDRMEFQQGFLIEVGLIDKTEPEPSTTTENIIPTPDPGDDDSYYVSKFIIGKHPKEFLADLNSFKRDLAAMTNNYCAAKGIVLIEDAGGQDVSIPLSSLRYCDRAWPPYETCVEASFGVAVYERTPQGDAYVMNAVKLDEMWALYSAAHGYTDYQPPSAGISQPALWLTVFLGIILVLLPVLCILWLKKWSDEYKRDSGVFEAVSTMTDGTERPVTFFDRQNPVYKTPRRGDLGFDNAGFDNNPVKRQNSLFINNERGGGGPDALDSDEDQYFHRGRANHAFENDDGQPFEQDSQIYKAY